jgi:hypothetical protein
MISGTIIDLGADANWTVTLTNRTTGVTLDPVSGMGAGTYSFASLTDGDDYLVSITSDALIDGVAMHEFFPLHANVTGDFSIIPVPPGS